MITRSTVRQSHSLLADVGVLGLLAALLYGVLRVARHWEAPLQPRVEIDLRIMALPVYTLLSLLRGIVAYGFSLTVALIYGYVAAHRPRAERILIPLLDILQSIPVLGFLPAAVLMFVSLSPHTNAGLELASIFMISTGQIWNIAFSFYQSLRSIPVELREAAELYQFNWWQQFRRMELPASAVGLAWNSMMAMAGGWFFLTVCEAFTLGANDFRLPGLGAYLSVAIAQGNRTAISAGIVAMILMIVVVDTCLWRPVIIWTQKFRLEDTAGGETQSSFVLNWLRRSWLGYAAMTWVAHPISEWLAGQANPRPEARVAPARASGALTGSRLMNGMIIAAGLIATSWAGGHLAQILAHLSLAEWGHLTLSALLTFLRVVAAVVLGSLWTIPAGIWIGRSDRRCKQLQPFVQIAASFPAPILYPLLLPLLNAIGCGLGIGASIFMFLGTQWYILFNVIAGVSAVPLDLREAASAYQFTARQWWKTLWWPAIFPYLITGWVTAAGGAWNASIVAEYLSQGSQAVVTPGLGSLISLAASQGRYDLLAAGVLVMACLVILINRYVWNPLYRLAELRYSY